MKKGMIYEELQEKEQEQEEKSFQTVGFADTHSSPCCSPTYLPVNMIFTLETGPQKLHISAQEIVFSKPKSDIVELKLSGTFWNKKEKSEN